MKWTRRRFNPNTLRVEQVHLTRKEIVRGVVVRLLSVVAIGATSVWLFDQVFQSPADRARDREIAFLEGQLESMRGDVAMMEAAMEDMAHRDDAVYRTLLGVQPVPEHLRNPGTGGADRHVNIRGHVHTEEVADLKTQIAALQRSMVAQSKSLDEVTAMALEYEDRLESIPAIQPVRNEDLYRMAGGYGWRLHPIYKVRKFHHGLDFSAPEGTEIFATGDGEVVKVKRLVQGLRPTCRHSPRLWLRDVVRAHEQVAREEGGQGEARTSHRSSWEAQAHRRVHTFTTKCTKTARR